VIMVGAADSYEARCRACHQVPRSSDAQRSLL
jgi:thymidine kinase